MESKIYQREELKQELERLRGEGRKIVFTNGCFDILHVGHVRYLQAAKDMGDVLVLALNSDASVKSLKGDKRPLITESERAVVVAALTSVDYVIIFSETTPLSLIEDLRPDVLVKGGDWAEEEVVGGEAVARWGGKVAIIPYIVGASTTNIVGKISKVYAPE